MAWWIAYVGAVSGAACACLVAWRMRASLPVAGTRHLYLSAPLAGAAGGLCAVLAANLAGSWWWLAPLAVWAVALASCAACDAATQRIPTGLVGYATAATALLLVGSAAATGAWRPLFVAALCATAAGVVLLVCWRFLGLGFGDVRLGVLGGLGLGGTDPQAIAAAIAVFAVITASQAVQLYWRTRNRHATFPLGPALAAAFFTAAAV